MTARRPLVLVVVLATVAGCYRPAPDAACVATCTALDPSCPVNMSCGADLRCYAIGASECSDGGVVGDGVVGDGSSELCYGRGLTEFGAICNPTVTVASLTLPHDLSPTAAAYDTTSCANAIVHTQLDDSEVCVVIAGSIDVVGTFAAVGSRPLVLIATDTLSIEATGSLGVASSAAGARTVFGAGANGASCVAMAGGHDASGDGGGGGAGGAFQGGGGAGGSGGGSGSAGSATAPLGQPTALRGGCPGATGGYSGGLIVDDHGNAGGAIYLIAGTSITVDGMIDASGGGAPAATTAYGGGGGGAGGMIALEAPILTVAGSAFVFASGGGGGGGGGTGAGGPGGDPTNANAASGAPGGASTSADSAKAESGAGGSGSSLAQLGGTAATASTGAGAGGGGGGGGAGYILVFAPSAQIGSGVTIIPPAS